MFFDTVKILLLILIIIVGYLIFHSASAKESWDFDDYPQYDICQKADAQNIPRFGGVPSKADFWPCLRTIPRRQQSSTSRSPS